jgi:hypothetical protein
LKENCEKIRTENDTLMNLPLTVNFYVSYKNKYCALCNNETDKYRTWSLNWDCRDFVDFNFISPVMTQSCEHEQSVHASLMRRGNSIFKDSVSQSWSPHVSTSCS